MSQILFICNSNRSASKMAAAYLAHKLIEAGRSDFDVISAGLAVRKGDGIPQAAIDVLAEVGAKSETLLARQLSLKEIKSSDLIICLTDEVLKKVTDSFRSSHGKTIHLMTLADGKRDVFEPRSTPDACRNCLNMMKPALDTLAARLLA